jgi:hypothetical protein
LQDDDRLIRYNVLTVNDNALPPSQNLLELHDVCDRLRKMGYAEFKRIRIYGQEFEVVSNPFPQGNGIAVRAFSKRDLQARTLQIPLPVLQMLGKKRKIA